MVSWLWTFRVCFCCGCSCCLYCSDLFLLVLVILLTLTVSERLRKETLLLDYCAVIFSNSLIFLTFSTQHTRLTSRFIQDGLAFLACVAHHRHLLFLAPSLHTRRSIPEQNKTPVGVRLSSIGISNSNSDNDLTSSGKSILSFRLRGHPPAVLRRLSVLPKDSSLLIFSRVIFPTAWLTPPQRHQ